MTALPPCSCGCARFGLVRDVAVEIVATARAGFGYVPKPQASLLVCLACGTLRFQLLDHARFLESVKHEVVGAAAAQGSTTPPQTAMRDVTGLGLASSASAVKEPGAGAPVGPRAGTRTKVLVFEHGAFANELRGELTRLGWVVTVVDDAGAGLAQAAADPPDLILLSAELPKTSGFVVCNKLKKDPQLGRIPLVMMSSEVPEETFEQHRKLRTRADDYVHKPIAFGVFLERLRRLVQG